MGDISVGSTLQILDYRKRALHLTLYSIVLTASDIELQTRFERNSDVSDIFVQHEPEIYREGLTF
jgi:hypothetical protein